MLFSLFVRECSIEPSTALFRVVGALGGLRKIERGCLKNDLERINKVIYFQNHFKIAII